MDLNDILTISGKSGLYKVISKTKNNIIAESLEDGKRIPVFAANHSSVLEDISVFTYDEDIPLKEVLWKIYEVEQGKCSIDPKSDNKTLKNFFEKIVPEYDKERVYPSDIKKIIMWYNILFKHNLITKPDSKEEEKSEENNNKTGEEKKDDANQNLNDQNKK